MADRIAVAGATGNLGGRIVRALVGRGAEVVALARPGAEDDKIEALEADGATVAVVEPTDAAALAKACGGSACVVSALQGLRDVILGAQAVLLQGAVAAGVPRFIPSDFSSDFTRLRPGSNRNFDLRRQFHAHLDAAPIAATSIFNGAFAEILAYGLPILDFRARTVGYWDEPDRPLDFTTIDDVAAYTAAAALDPTTPRRLRIAGFQVTPAQLRAFAEVVVGSPFELRRLGSLDDLAARNQAARAEHPGGEDELYPGWQQGQYLHSMFSAHHEETDNARYPELTWTTLEEAVRPPA